MNKVILTGRLTADPDVRYTTGENSTAVATFTLAVNRRFVQRDAPNAQTADFIRCQAFGRAAENVRDYYHKGMKMDLCGKLRTGKYTNKEGQTVYTTDVVIEEHEFGESKKAASGNSETPMATPSVDINIPDGVDEELPFN